LFPAAGLNAGLFVGRDNKVVSAQRSAFPNAMVQIEDRAGRQNWDHEERPSFDVAKVEGHRY
jgi:hypothetical protein